MNFGFAGLLILAAFVNAISTREYIRGCYFTNWAQHRSGIGKFMPENIEHDLCSHIFFSFVSMGDDFKLKHVEANDVDDNNGTVGLYSRINSIKNNQTDLKTLLSFGGFVTLSADPYDVSQTVPDFSLMRKLLDSADNRKIFIDSAIDFVRLHKFDGFDFNWYPEAHTKDGFAKLVKEFRESIDKEADKSKRPRLLLTAGLPPQVNRIEASYDGKVLAESLDWLNVFAMDYHGSWENKTGFNTPMFDRDNDGVSINTTFAHLIEKQQIPKDKLVMGYATYGRGWKLPSSSAPNSIPSPAEGPSPAQPFTLTEGTAAYFEICDLIEKENFVENFDDVQKVPYIFKDGVWIGYDNPRSYEAGLDWLIEKDLAGLFVWALDMDDFLGHCSSSNGTYPLIKTIRSKLTKKE